MNMRKYLLPSALILALGLSFAWAQSITKSVQLSQDATGKIGYDTKDNVYFPAHVLSRTDVRPAPVVGSSCGTSGATIVGTDFSGVATVGGSATTSCVITFGTAFVTAPNCVVAPMSGILAAFSWATSTTALTVTQTSTASNTIAYICTSVS